jgi:DNA-binding NarL/FixJ family response regulator
MRNSQTLGTLYLKEKPVLLYLRKRVIVTPIQIVILADHPAVRTALVMSFSAHTDFSVVGQTADSAAAILLSTRLCPDLILIDIDRMAQDGLPVMCALRQECPDTRVVALSMRDDPRTYQAVAACGAAAFISKAVPVDCLPDALRYVANLTVVREMYIPGGEI